MCDWCVSRADRVVLDARGKLFDLRRELGHGRLELLLAVLLVRLHLRGLVELLVAPVLVVVLVLLLRPGNLRCSI